MTLSSTLRRFATAGAGTLALTVAAVFAAPTASAATETGWTGGTSPQAGYIYAHSSSVSNDAGIVASTTVWNAFGTAWIPANWVGVNARLFKSGVLCESEGFIYNEASGPNLRVQTSGAGCGPGSYNSHGIVETWNGSGFTRHITFPTNPINVP